MRYFYLPLILFCTSSSFAQVFSYKVDVNVTRMPIHKVLDSIQDTYHLHFSYGLDRTTGNTPVSIKATNTTLYNIITDIARQAKLEFSIIGTMVVFKPKKENQRLVLPASTIVTLTDSTIHELQKDSARQVIPSITIAQPPATESMSIPIITLTPVPLPPPSAVRIASPSRFGIAIGTVVDKHHYHFNETTFDFQYYRYKINTGITLSFSYRLYKRINVSTALIINNKDFTFHHNFIVFDTSDPFPIPSITKIQQRYWEVPLVINVQFFQLKKLKCHAQIGIHHYWLSSKSETTSYLNKENTSTTYYLPSTRQHLQAISTGITFSYPVYKTITAFLSPSLLSYNSETNTIAMNTAARSLRLTSGVHYTFLHYTKS